jgi:glycosyltransferase involved in cell wall biosynthesis
VLVAIDSLGNGGTERQLALLVQHLPPEWERDVCALEGGPFEAYLGERGIGVTVFRRRSRLDPLPAVALARAVGALRPDVVHSWSWISTLSAGPVCRALGVPLVDGTIRTGSVRPAHARLKRLGMALSTTVVANSHAGIQAWGVGPAKGRVVYNAFDWSRIDDLARLGSGVRTAGHDAGSPLSVVMAGRMEPVKDYRVVLAAARLLRSQGESCRFVLVGQGSERQALISEAGDLIETGHVVFPAPGIEVLGQVLDAHIGVLMTDPRRAQEGCSNAIMEYMACGLPVVCGDGGGNAELVDDGKTGFVVPPADARSLADRLARLIHHDDERRSMGAAGRRRVVERFSVDRMVAAFVRLYEDSLTQRGRAKVRGRSL